MRRAPAAQLASAFFVVLGVRPVGAAVLAGAQLSGADSGVLFRADFSTATTPEQQGWQVLAAPDQSTYEFRDGVLRVTCMQNWHNGGMIRKAVPVARRGVLEFDACIALENRANALGVSLVVSIYNISTWFHDYCKDWRRYFPEGPGKRLPGFKIEPVGHRRLASVTKGEWAHYRILFDHETGVVEYYRNDMDDPAHIDYDVPVLGRAEYEGGALQIGSMGITKGAVVHGLRNVVLRTLPEPAVDDSERGRDVLLFKGISADLHGIEATLTATADGDNVRTYALRTHGAAVSPVNQLELGRLPSSATVARAAKILLLDMPAEPGACLPSALLEQMVAAVHAGAELVVFGGMFALGKGGYIGSPLEGILPVELAGAWEVRALPGPAALKSGAGVLGTPEEGRPAVRWYHRLTPGDDAEVLLTAGQEPMLVRRRVGRGTVAVFLGVPCGEWADHPKRLVPFWRSRAWRAWLRDNVLGPL